MDKDTRGKACEYSKKEASRRRGCEVIPGRIGYDYLELCTNKPPTLVEVKSGKSQLTKTQRETREWARKVGFDYRLDRCVFQ